MNDLSDIMAEQAPLSTFPASAREAIAEHAHIASFEPGERLLQTAEPADTIHVVRRGRVAIEVMSPRGGSIVIETIGPGELLGISWMVPPYQVSFDARCVERCETIAIDASAVRDLCDADAAFGYRMYKHFAGVVRDRLQAARVQLLDLYGGRDG